MVGLLGSSAAQFGATRKASRILALLPSVEHLPGVVELVAGMGLSCPNWGEKVADFGFVVKIVAEVVGLG